MRAGYSWNIKMGNGARNRESYLLMTGLTSSTEDRSAGHDGRGQQGMLRVKTVRV